jgi:transposase-like protein
MVLGPRIKVVCCHLISSINHDCCDIFTLVFPKVYIIIFFAVIMENKSPCASKRSRYKRDSTEVVPTNPPIPLAEDQVDLTKLTSRQLALASDNEEQAFAFSLRLGLISLEPGKCPDCGNDMRLAKKANKVGGHLFFCTKQCGKSISILCSTWFEGTNLKLWQVLDLTYHFCCIEPVTKAALQCEVTEDTACN